MYKPNVVLVNKVHYVLMADGTYKEVNKRVAPRYTLNDLKAKGQVLVLTFA